MLPASYILPVIIWHWAITISPNLAPVNLFIIHQAVNDCMPLAIVSTSEATVTSALPVETINKLSYVAIVLSLKVFARKYCNTVLSLSAMSRSSSHNS